MGVCHSGCHAPPPELEYYDAWRHSVLRQKKRSNPRFKSKKQALRSPHCCMLGQNAVGVIPAPSRVWVCAHGCCSIRWKLDYEALHSYKAYADLSPYVVTVGDTRSCRCVICRGLPAAQWDLRGESAWSRASRSSRDLTRTEACACVPMSKASGKTSFSSGESLTDDEELMM